MFKFSSANEDELRDVIIKFLGRVDEINIDTLEMASEQNVLLGNFTRDYQSLISKHKINNFSSKKQEELYQAILDRMKLVSAFTDEAANNENHGLVKLESSIMLVKILGELHLLYISLIHEIEHSLET